jgi:flagellar motility protein MotE (MotC chaperone)
MKVFFMIEKWLRIMQSKWSYRWRLLPMIIFSAVLFLTLKMTSLVTYLVQGKGTLGALAYAEVKNPDKGGTAASDLPTELPKKADPLGLDQLDPFTMDQSQYKAIKNLKAQKKKLEDQEREFPKKYHALKSIEKKIEEKTKSLQEAQNKLEGLVKGVDEKEKINLDRLVKMAEGMKPTEAAPILEGIDFPILLEIMELIKPGKASAILAAMAPNKAAYLMTQLALRKKMIKLEGDEEKVAP